MLHEPETANKHITHSVNNNQFDKSVSEHLMGSNRSTTTVVHTLTLDGVVLDVLIGHGGRQGQSVTPDTGSDVRDTEGQRAPVLLVNESRHGAGFRNLVCRHVGKKETYLHQVKDTSSQMQKLSPAECGTEKC